LPSPQGGGIHASIDDQLALKTLYATYKQSVDRDRVDATVACFTPRGALVVGEPRRRA
jgi:hypothetical protein